MFLKIRRQFSENSHDISSWLQSTAWLLTTAKLSEFEISRKQNFSLSLFHSESIMGNEVH